MDKSKHVVSVPWDDYKRMAEAEDRLSVLEHNIQMHFDLLRKSNGPEIIMKYNKIPKKAFIGSPNNPNGATIQFTYE